MSETVDLETIEARANAATRGPWRMGTRGWPDVVMTPYGCLWDPYMGRINDIEDGDFVAHAREDVPALIAHIRDLEGRIEQTESGWQRTNAELIRVLDALPSEERKRVGY